MLKVIEKIAEAKGKEKIEVMQKYPALHHILKYTYDPFKKYYMTAPEVPGVEGGLPFTSTPWADTLLQLTDRTISGQRALEVISDMLAAMDESSAELFKRILNKDLRCGINIKSINKAFPNLIPLTFDGSKKPDIANCVSFNKNKAVYPLMVAVKKDGVRGRMSNKNLLTRQGKKIIGCEHIEKELETFPHDLDGELMVPGVDFDTASGLIRNYDSVPDAEYWVFDAPSFPGSKRDRYAFLAQKLVNTVHVKLIRHFIVNDEEQLISFYRNALQQGEEGIVIYDPNSLYIDGKIWWRLVPKETADCPVVGFYEGKGKHENSLGGIIVDYKGHEVNVGTGFSEKVKKSELKQLVSEIDKKLAYSDSKETSVGSIEDISPILRKLRKVIWDHQELFLGVVAECEFKEETKAGSMRQPRFKRWRLDK